MTSPLHDLHVAAQSLTPEAHPEDAPQIEPSRPRKAERDQAVLSGQLPPGSEELVLIDEYRLASWLSGPGR